MSSSPRVPGVRPSRLAVQRQHPRHVGVVVLAPDLRRVELDAGEAVRRDRAGGSAGASMDGTERERGPHLAGRLETIGRVRLHRRQQETAPARRTDGRPPRAGVDRMGRRLLGPVVRERVPVDYQLVEHDAEGEQVGVRPPAGSGHVRCPIAARAGLALRLARLRGNVEVDQLGPMRRQLQASRSGA